jgi:hypothetical protein
MQMLLIWYAGILVLVSCTRADVEKSGAIVSCASVRDMNATRSAYTGTNLSVNPLKALVLASLADADYTALYCRGAMTFNGNATPAAYNKPVADGDYEYPDATTPVYLSGLYPSAGWTGAEGAWTFTLTGKEDVMFAPQVNTRLTDVWNDRYATLEFARQLTLMRLWLYCDEEVADRIRVKAILLDKANGSGLQTAVTVTLNGAQAVAFAAPGSPGPLACYAAGTDDAYAFAAGTEYLVTTTASEQAYVLAPPVTAADAADAREYAFVVSYLDGTTEKTRQVDIDLKQNDAASFNGTTAAYAFDIIFRFTGGGRIVPHVSLVNWLPGGEYEIVIADNS